MAAYQIYRWFLSEPFLIFLSEFNISTRNDNENMRESLESMIYLRDENFMDFCDLILSLLKKKLTLFTNCLFGLYRQYHLNSVKNFLNLRHK